MLLGLDAIDWAHLHHAYGSAADVPGLLRQVLEEDAARREEAIYELFGNIVHQGTVYEATAYAVPFLIGLVAGSDIPERYRLLYLLQTIATGSSYLAAFSGETHFPDLQRQWGDLVVGDQADFDREVAQAQVWVTAAHEAVARGFEVYASLLQEGNDEERFAAAYLLGALPEQASRSMPLLEKRLASETHLSVRVALLLSLAALTPPDDWPSFQKMIDDDNPPFVNIVAAAVVVSKARDEAPEQTVARLLAWLHMLREGSPAPGLLPEPMWNGQIEDGLNIILAALSQLPAARAIPALLQACHHQTNTFVRGDICTLLLNLAFAGGADLQGTAGAWLTEWQIGYPEGAFFGQYPQRPPDLRDPASLTMSQRAVLEAIASLPSPLTQIVDRGLLRYYGLPETRKQMRGFLSQAG